MPTLVVEPTRIRAAGTKPKRIDECIGRINAQTSGVSVVHMRNPQGWEEPGQTPEFDRFTPVLKGVLHVKDKGGRDGAGGHRPPRQSGFDIPRPPKAQPNTLPSACRPFHGGRAPRRMSRRGPGGPILGCSVPCGPCKGWRRLPGNGCFPIPTSQQTKGLFIRTYFYVRISK